MNRHLLLLTLVQGLFLTNNVTFIAINGIVGLSLAPVGWMATLPITAYVLGSAMAAMPVAWMQAHWGRRRSFQAGLVVAMLACAMAAWAVASRSFWLLLAATVTAGFYAANAALYRFAGPELAAPSYKERAISLVLAGGIVGGFLGPAITRWGRDLFAAPFLGSFVLLAGVALVALAVQSRVHVPKPHASEQAGGGRPLRDIVRQPVFVVAALSAVVGYGLMNLLMTATPLAMDFCGLPYAQAAFVISWHVVGMYAPGFVTGSLIDRFGVLNVILAGAAVMAAGALVALTGNALAHFLAALVLIGVGWNFMYTGGTALLTESYTPAEKARTQGANDFIMFSTMAVSSFSSGAMVSTTGWEAMNWTALPVLAAVAGAVVWYGRRRHPDRRMPAR